VQSVQTQKKKFKNPYNQKVITIESLFSFSKYGSFLTN